MILKTFPPGAFYNTYTDVHTLYIKCARDKLYKKIAFEYMRISVKVMKYSILYF